MKMNIVMGNGASGNCVELIRAIWREKRANKAVKKWAGTVKGLKRLFFLKLVPPQHLRINSLREQCTR